MKAIFQRLAALSALAVIYVSPVSAQTRDSIREVIRKKFPDVRQLSTADLAAWLADTNRPAPFLVDAREPEEFQVSHLRGARNLTAVKAVKAAVQSGAPPVVVYCSVGYRSSALVEKLQKAGLTNVFNLSQVEKLHFGLIDNGNFLIPIRQLELCQSHEEVLCESEISQRESQ